MAKPKPGTGPSGMPREDERVRRLQKGWKYADEAKAQAAKGAIGPYDEEDRPGSEVVAPLVKETQKMMSDQGEMATRKIPPTSITIHQH